MKKYQGIVKDRLHGLADKKN